MFNFVALLSISILNCTLLIPCKQLRSTAVWYALFAHTFATRVGNCAPNFAQCTRTNQSPPGTLQLVKSNSIIAIISHILWEHFNNEAARRMWGEQLPSSRSLLLTLSLRLSLSLALLCFVAAKNGATAAIAGAFGAFLMSLKLPVSKPSGSWPMQLAQLATGSRQLAWQFGRSFMAKLLNLVDLAAFCCCCSI